MAPLGGVVALDIGHSGLRKHILRWEECTRTALAYRRNTEQGKVSPSHQIALLETLVNWMIHMERYNFRHCSMRQGTLPEGWKVGAGRAGGRVKRTRDDSGIGARGRAVLR
jgi:hypothetical protein